MILERVTNTEIRNELDIILLEWIRKAVKEGPATPAEVEALPKVAGVLLNSLINL